MTEDESASWITQLNKVRDTLGVSVEGIPESDAIPNLLSEVPKGVPDKTTVAERLSQPVETEMDRLLYIEALQNMMSASSSSDILKSFAYSRPTTTDASALRTPTNAPAHIDRPSQQQLDRPLSQKQLDRPLS
eukprot:208143_1